MEKNPTSPDKSLSFRKDANNKNDSPRTLTNISDNVDTRLGSPISEETEEKENAEENPGEPNKSLAQVLDEVDRFLQTLSVSDEKSDSDPPDVPNSVEALAKIVDSMVAKYNDVKSLIWFGQDPENDASFIEALNRISELSNKLSNFPSLSSSLNRTSSVLQKTMSFLDEEFRTLLEDSKPEKEPDQKSNKTSKQSSFNNAHTQELSDRCVFPDSDDSDQKEEEFSGFSLEIIRKLNKIATTMINSGYESECSMAYTVSRRSSFKTTINKLGYDNISIDEIQKMQWESLEREITTWIAVVKNCSAVLFPGERNLADSVFSDHQSISQTLYSNLTRVIVLQLLNFAEAVVLTKRSAEKLFKFLDMYETLRDLVHAIINGDSYTSSIAKEITNEASTTKSRLGEAIVSIFCDMENSIKSDNGRIPVPSGAVHPLTRYVMNYLKYACEYKETLEQVFQQRVISENDSNKTKTAAFSNQLLSVMDLLDANLDMKSKLYRDPSLRFIFLMNNGRYIVQKIKGSTEIHQLMGDTWCRKRSSNLRQYHKNYQRETWGKVLQCLGHEGLQVNGKVSKPVLKERFKMFTAMFDEIHKTQSTWVVSDEQLQSELRVSISAVMIPAYRNFLGRFKQFLDPGRQVEKYIKYQSEDIETMIEEFFDGNPTSMSRRRT
ncbi:hypothetical protein UlMin_039948 [Ulmus minor]